MRIPKTLALQAPKDPQIKSAVVIDLFRKQSTGKAKLTRAERFTQKVDTSAGVNACHPWLGSITQCNGYGQFSDTSPITGEKTMRTAHVVAWELANGRKVPKGKHILHARGCSKACCNPKHLRPGTPTENMADAIAEKRLNHRLTKSEVLEIVVLHQRDLVSITALAHRFRVVPQTIVNVTRGKSHSKLTGVKFEKRKGGRPSAQIIPLPVKVQQRPTVEMVM